MSTTTTDISDYTSPFSTTFGKSSPQMYVNGPSVSTPTSNYSTNTMYTTNNTNGQDFTNLTPMMNSSLLQQTSFMNSTGNSSTNGDSSNPSSASSSRTRLANLCDDSGNGTLLLSSGHQISYGSPQMDMKTDDDLDPIPRDRCNTWPMRRPNLDINNQTSPLIHDRIPEEDNLYDSGDNLSRSGSMSNAGAPSSTVNSSFSNEFGQNLSLGSPEDGSDDASGNSKKSTTRRNAWGNMSYADLITQAILNSPEKRLTLSQVYEWMVQNVPYFRDKGDSNSSAGWKNSIRHNLSLHSRFMRIQNEGAGKSSWWVINPDAKPGRNPRRRAATMESATKTALDKKRRGARKRVEMAQLRTGQLHSAGSSAIGSTASIISHDLYNDQDDPLNSNFDTFRQRTQSNLSCSGNNARISPSLDQFDDFDFPPPAAWSLNNQERSSNPEVNEIMGRTDQMSLNGPPDYRPNTSGSMNSFAPKMEMKGEPPSYQEVNGIRPSNMQSMQPPMMRPFNPQQSQGPQPQHPQMQPMRMNNVHNNGYYHPMNVYNNVGMMSSNQPQQHNNNSQNWTNNPMDPYVYPQRQQTSLFESHQGNGPLPLDLENLNLPEQGMLDLDLDAVIRHEMAHGDQTMNFDGL